MKQIKKALIRSKTALNEIQESPESLNFGFVAGREVYEIEKALEDLDKVEKLIKAKDKYIKLLEDELEETVPIAANHHWRSTRHEKGKEIRGMINELSK